jgi:glucosamine kinase
MAQELYLGIDGGGTRCRARLRDAGGRLLGEAEGGLANIYQDFAGAIARIRSTAEAAADRAGLPASALASAHAGLGLAGVMSPDAAARVEGAGLPFGTVTVDNDAYAACLGAHDGGDGGIVIAGTGSAGLALVGEARVSLGGWGSVIGDGGSGAVIGRDALRRAVLAYDGLVETSPLLEALLARFDRDVPRIADWARTALSRDFGALAPMVLEAAAAGDPPGLAVAGEAADAIAALARGLVRAGAPRVALIGSVALALRGRLPADIAAILVEPVRDPLDGAILMARRHAGRSTA